MTGTFTHHKEGAFHVTLVRPPAISTASSLNVSSLTPPIALAYLSSALINAGYSVTNIDSIGEAIHNVYLLSRNPKMSARGLSAEQIISRIPKHTDLIGISCMFSLEWPATRDLILEIRKAFPNTPIVAGGEHITALPEFSMQQCPAIDFAVLGEGDQILLELIESIIENTSVSEIQGLAYKNNNSILFGKNTKIHSASVFEGVSGRRIKDLDELTWPAWHITPLNTYLDEKLTFGRLVGKTMPLLASRGCPYDCTFCSNPKMWGRKYNTRSAKDVVQEIAYYKDKYNIEAVEFYDLTPIIKKSWILEFCDELISQNVKIKWQISGGTRCEAIDEEVIVKSKLSGCEYIGFAPESASQVVLDRIKKKINLAHMVNLIKIARKHNVDTRCNLIIGFPEDTRMQIYQSLLFQIKLAFLGVTDCPIFDFTPYPGSELFEKLRTEGVIKELSDEYFESLGLNMQLAKLQYCKNISPTELLFYRTLGMSMFYGLYYLFRPLKFFKLLKNLVHYETSNSVFEQRIIQNTKNMSRRRNLAASENTVTERVD